MVRSHSFSLQFVLISTGILSLALLFKVSVPLVVDFSVYRAPILWSSIVSWLKPPYLYVIVNCIIITIAASSRFHHSHAADQDKDQHHEHISAPKITIREPDFHYEMKISAAEEINSRYVDPEPMAPVDVYELKEETISTGGESRVVFVDKSTEVNGVNNVPAMEVDDKVDEDAFVVSKSRPILTKTMDSSENLSELLLLSSEKPLVVEDKGEEDDFFISKSTWIPPKRMDSSENLSEFLLLPAEKPLVSTRFGHRKPVKASPEGGRALRVAKPKRQETLENTWKMITEGRPMPLTRHMKKSETFDQGHHQVSGVDQSQWKKSETFKDRTNYQPPPVNNSSSSSSSPSSSSGKLRKEASLGQDELNRRVEAFIKKFNEEMRMQRQESLNQYKEMVNRGAIRH
ncbi:uncharacterized protein [Euphorbia lathyris]|uniref:uncharacterized protein n=1 Tax=Euphorbia lathyris TaxID=212925 RepID=UPI0033135253